jgi:hypothetical protein
MSPTEERDAAIDLAPTNTTNALTLARGIADPWFRCQALAWVARYAFEELVLPLAHEALDTALQQVEGYKAVAVSAWPVRAVIERDQTDPLPPWLSELLKRARDIDHPVRRLDALLLLWQGAFLFQHSATDEIFEEFLRACDAADSWKAGYCLEEGILILALRDPARATELAERMGDGRYKRRTLKKLSELTKWPPRPFFWADT